MPNDHVYIIAEVGQAHDGSLGILHSYIDAIAQTGVDAIKFQTHIAEAESSEYEPFRVNFSYEDKTRFDYWKRVSFDRGQWLEIKQHCNQVGLDFISSPFSIAAVELLEGIGIDKYKIGSGEVSNMLMLELIAETKKPVILSSGMSSYAELDAAVDLFNLDDGLLTLLQCTTKYPSGPEDVGLNVIQEMRQRYGIPVGLSDHSGTIYPSLAAAAQGANALEAHVVFDKRMFGPDSASSLTVDEFKMLSDGVRSIEKMHSSPVDKNDNQQFAGLKKIFEKSLAINCDLDAGEEVKRYHLEAKKPAEKGIPASEFSKVLGKRLIASKKQWDFINWSDFE
ncbi:MAG: N-acetylneuraminate synthase [Gammaproteobacteria bacterium]|mgnify:CR=1 FL=1|nr:MAG: N-acetylneuraminate synthase [Gammaproteobacteria bacterium]